MKIKSIFTAKKNAVGSSLLVAAGSANAALPTPVTDAFTAVGTAVTDMEAQAWPVVTAVVVAFALITLFKKFANKAL